MLLEQAQHAPRLVHAARPRRDLHVHRARHDAVHAHESSTTATPTVIASIASIAAAAAKDAVDAAVFAAVQVPELAVEIAVAAAAVVVAVAAAGQVR